jgi:signal transduction histidine kinase/CheY-like chemotaxis protein
MAEDKSDIESLRKEANYYRKKTDELAGENLRLDYTVSGLRHELKQKRAGFKLLSSLHETLGAQRENLEIFRSAGGAINSTLGMDKTIVLYPTDKENVFRPVIGLGGNLDENKIAEFEIEFPEPLVKAQEVRIVNKATASDPLIEKIRSLFELPYFIVCAVRSAEQTLALFVSGRLVEAKPLYPPLDGGDADSFVSISGLIAAIVETMKVASLKENDRLKTEFFANISHEFRTPITLTIGPLEAMISGKYGEVGDRVRKEIEIILRNQYRLLDLINQILDLAKLESGSMKPSPVRVANFNEFMERRLEQFNPMTEKRGLELLRKYDEAVAAASIYVDPEKFDKVIFNLLSNATKFTKKGSITVETKIAGQQLEFSVTDTGMGIRADQLGHIFDRFRQADGSQSREFAGTGIGLSLVKQIVEIHGGQIAVLSEYGKGTTFKVTVPLGKAHFPEDVKIEESPASSIETAAKSSQVVDVREGRASEAELQKVLELNDAALADQRVRKKILYADDNADLRSFVHGLLSEEYTLILAVNGQDGFEKAKKYDVDLVISDLMMPVWTGADFVNHLKADPLTSAIPFIMLTAKGGLDTKVEELGRGVDDFLSKPFSALELQARVRNLIKIREQQRRIKKDLAAARGIQQSLLPGTDLEFGGFKAEFMYRPCEELSGDFFDIRTVKDKTYFYIADVTSHGTASAQVTYLLRGIFNKLVERPSVGSVDRFVAEMAKEFLSLKLDYAVGLCFGVFGADGQVECLISNFPNPWILKEGRISALSVPLSDTIDPMFFGQELNFKSAKFALEPGESFFAFTDGLYEFPMIESGRDFGERALSRILQKYPGESWRDELFSELVRIQGSSHFGDDMTILRLKRLS